MVPPPHPLPTRPIWGKWTVLITLLTLLNSLFHKVLEQTHGSQVNDHGDRLPQGLQEGSQSHGSRRAVCLFWGLVVEVCGEAGGDEHGAGMGQ